MNDERDHDRRKQRDPVNRHDGGEQRGPVEAGRRRQYLVTQQQGSDETHADPEAPADDGWHDDEVENQVHRARDQPRHPHGSPIDE